MDKDDIIEQLAATIYYSYCNLHSVKGARWQFVEPRHQESVWRAKAREALGI